MRLVTADLHITGLLLFSWNNHIPKRGKHHFSASWLHSAKLRASAGHVGRCHFPSSMCNGHFQLSLNLLVPTPKPGIKTEKSISQAQVSVSYGTSTTGHTFQHRGTGCRSNQTGGESSQPAQSRTQQPGSMPPHAHVGGRWSNHSPAAHL